MAQLSDALLNLEGLRELIVSQRSSDDRFVPLLLRGAFGNLERLRIGYRNLSLPDLLDDVEHHLPQLSTLVLEASNEVASLREDCLGWVTTIRRDEEGSLRRLEARFIPYPGRSFRLTFGNLERFLLPKLGRELRHIAIEVKGRVQPSSTELESLRQVVETFHPEAQYQGPDQAGGD